MLQNPCKTLGFKKKTLYTIPPGGEVIHIQPVAYVQHKLQDSVLCDLYFLYVYRINILTKTGLFTTE